MSNKMPLRWHKECLENMKKSAERAAIAAAQAKAEAERLAANVALYESQIVAAEEAGKDGFDRDRWFLRKVAK